MPPKTPRHSGISAASTPNLPTYSFGDIVLAKVKGHPAWPARIVDPYVAPLNLRDERKISQKNSYLVKFFKTADYAWMNAKEMSMLGASEIRAFIDNPNKKGADLKAAYQIALAPEAWEAEIESFQQQYDEEQKALEIDELDPVENDGLGKTVPLKPKQKRKRPSETKTAVTPAKKRKSEANGSAKKSATPEPAAPVAPVKKAGKKKKEEAVVPVDGEAVVREWRHKLQRLFLGKVPLTEKMMPEISDVFSDIENFEMKAEWLHASKLAKVLKRVGVLEDSLVPLDAEYNIRARSRALQDKWRQAFGFPEDSNRQKVVEAGQENNSEAVHGKESADPSDSKNEVADQKVSGSPVADVANGGVDNIQANGSVHDGDNKVEDDQQDPPKVEQDITMVEQDPPKLEQDPPAVEQNPPTVEQNPPTVEQDPPKVEQDPPKVEQDPPKVEQDPPKVEQDPPKVDALAQQSSSTEAQPVQVNGHHEEKPAEDVTMDAPENQEARKVDAPVDESPVAEAKPVQVNGNHAEKPIEDVIMAAADGEAKVVVEDKDKLQAEDNEDEGEQMDCADSPEPVTVVSNDAETKEKVVAPDN